MNPFQCKKEKRSRKVITFLNNEKIADKDDRALLQSSPCPSSVDSTLDNSNDDPTYEYSDSHESENSLSDNERSCFTISDVENRILPESGNVLQQEKILDVEEINKFQFSKYVSGRRIGKKRTFCKFCEDSVTNFERHLERHHTNCKEVKDMMKYQKKSKKRREIIQVIRNDGNFKEYVRNRVIPLYQRQDTSADEIQPCAHCKGLYRKNFSYRHYKKCVAAKISKNPGKIQHISASQTLIACALETNNVLNKLRVKNEVFNKMKADEISLVVKTDPLIYLFGENYLKSHFRAQMSTSCSNKMRELARLLITLRKIEKDDNLKLADAIDPSKFEKIVECAKIIGGFDPESKRFKKSPSLSAHLGTSLKSVCNLILYLLQSQNQYINFGDVEAKYKATKRFRDLVTTQWTKEISSLAFKTLNEEKWNRPTILPLTKDILRFKNHVVKIANIAVAALEVNPNNAKEYKNLVNASLVLAILYNRRRIGDVQYTELKTYLRNFATTNQEELVNSLSSSEKFLTKHYKRVVTGGKGSRPIVILFPQQLQDFMNVLIDIRTKTDLVPETNKYLFAHPDSNSWIRADSILRNFAKKCNIEHPEHMTSNNLRKQIATVMQILNLSQEETKQFAKFIGHTGKTHDDFYTLTEDAYQTAKISKLLIMMDKGGGHEYKGKSLDEININPEEDVAYMDNSEDDEITNLPPERLTSSGNSSVNVSANSSNDLLNNSSTDMPANSSSYPSTSSLEQMKPRKQTGRSSWTVKQKSVINSYFKSHINRKITPRKADCEELKKLYPDLYQDKDWVRIKTFVYNTFRNKD